MAKQTLESYATELTKLLLKIQDIENKTQGREETRLEKRRLTKLRIRSKEIQVIILATKKRIIEEENKAFQENIIDEKTIRQHKIQTILDNLEVFTIKDDDENKTEITTKEQLQQKSTEWLIKTADESNLQLADIVGETNATN